MGKAYTHSNEVIVSSRINEKGHTSLNSTDIDDIDIGLEPYKAKGKIKKDFF